jgi:hypothetical protein
LPLCISSGVGMGGDLWGVDLPGSDYQL